MRFSKNASVGISDNADLKNVLGGMGKTFENLRVFSEMTILEMMNMNFARCLGNLLSPLPVRISIHNAFRSSPMALKSSKY